MRFLSFFTAEGDGRGVSCEVRRLKNRRVGDSSWPSSSLEVSSSRRTARKFVSVRVLHLSEPPEWPPPILPPPRNSPAILLKNPPLVLRSRSVTESDIERWGGASEGGWLNDPVPVPVPLLVVLLPLTPRGRVGRRERRLPTLAPVPAVANRTFSTTSTGRESSSLEPCSKSSGSSSSSVDGSTNSEIACAGGIWSVKLDAGGIGSGEEDRGGTRDGLATRSGVLLIQTRDVSEVSDMTANHARCWLVCGHREG